MPPQHFYQAPKTPGTAIASLITGIIGLPFSCCCMLVSGPLALSAIICGIIALSKIKSQPQLYSSSGKPMAIVGIVLGSIVIVLSIVMLAAGIAQSMMEKMHAP